MITISTLNLVIAIFAIFGSVFGVFFYFKNPQIKTDQDTLRLKDEVAAVRKEVQEIKETHLRSVEADIKNLTAAVAQLEKTVVKLTTIIDERIPRAPGVLAPTGP